LVGVAANVRALPLHVGFEPKVSAIVTEGTTVGLIEMVIWLETIEEGDAQTSLDVRIQLTTCPDVKDEVE
jgi:hypothetical protein